MTYLFNFSAIFIAIIVKPFSVGVPMALLAMGTLLLLSALISAAEAGFFSLGPTEIESLKSSGSKRDLKILETLDNPKRLLATLLISVNFVNIAIVLLSTFITNATFDFSESPLLGFFIQVVVITFMILLIGEVIPKIYSTQNPVSTARITIYPVLFFQRIFYPLSSFLIFSTSAIDKRVKQRAHNISVDQLEHALELTSEHELEQEDRKILSGIVKFGNIDVKQIMKPRTDVIAFEYEIKYKELIERIVNSGFSRVPIYKETLDKIIGVLYIKDLIPFLDADDNFNWQSLLRPSFFVPENKKIDDLLREFQHKKIHLAVVVDEYGGTSGIVTLEDVIEEIVGEINDEFDDDDIVYSKLDDNNFVFEGKVALTDLYRITGIEGEPFEEVKGDSDTLAGLLIEIEGRIPEKNDKIKFKNLTFHIESADARKIKRVKVGIDREEV